MAPGTGAFPHWGITTIPKRGRRDRGQAPLGYRGASRLIMRGMRPGTGTFGNRGVRPLVRRDYNRGQASIPNEDRRLARPRTGIRPDRGQALMPIEDRHPWPNRCSERPTNDRRASWHREREPTIEDRRLSALGELHQLCEGPPRPGTGIVWRWGNDPAHKNGNATRDRHFWK